MQDLILKKSWSLWHDLVWTDLRLVGNFQSVVEFWRLLNNVAEVSNLKHKTNLRIFHSTVSPTREDVANANGGQWIVQFYRDSFIDEVFLNLLLDAIGETLEEYNVTGIELNVRDRGNRICLWTKDYIPTIFDYLSKNCGQSVVSITYKKHEDILKNNSTFNAIPVFTFKKKINLVK